MALPQAIVNSSVLAIVKQLSVILATVLALVLSLDYVPGSLLESIPGVQYAPLAAVYSHAVTWLNVVNANVPEPYLDEFFHIPQSRRFCQGKWTVWDDKITTPPGLYLVSVAFSKILRTTCDAATLRYHNVIAIVVIGALSISCRAAIERKLSTHQGRRSNAEVSQYAVLTGVNIALFPVLFFFSGLYYTDLWSTLAVLACFRLHLTRVSRLEVSALASDLLVLMLGVVALFMRQTNVFWIVIWMGGLEVVHAVRSAQRKDTSADTRSHDPALTHAGPEDYFWCMYSLVLGVLYNTPRVWRQVWPHLALLGGFAGFVLWNGGVVLGDKSNHIATIHLAQMLYIWPLMALFSAPLFVPLAVSWAKSTLRLLQDLFDMKRRPSVAALIAQLHNPLRIVSFVASTAFSVLLVMHNTIIHPFTLADNRHYMFYVFRYSILRAPWIRYALVPIYGICQQLCWGRLEGPTLAADEERLAIKSEQQEATSVASTPGATKATKTHTSSTDSTTTQSGVSASVSVSTASLWLLTTSLSLITAPLVEPRYFILPWVFYRLSLPSWEISTTTMLASSERAEAGVPTHTSVYASMRRQNWSVFAETAWFLAINAFTQYMFIERPFVWKAADGSFLDDGRTQRFMW